jgi:hypothetical protein
MRFITFLVTMFITLSFVALAIADDKAEESSKLEFSGIMESNFSYITSEDNSESDLYLGKVELSADASLDSHFSGHLLFAYEHGEDESIALDEGSVDLKFPVKPLEFSLSLGRVVVPFGVFNTHFATEPFTLEMGEIKHNAIRISLSHSIIQACVALYNSKTTVDGENNSHIKDFSAMIQCSTPENALAGKASIALGTSFISNVSGLESISEMIGESTGIKRVAGLNGFAGLNVMGVFLEGEAILVLDDLEISKAEKIKPYSFNVELGYALQNLPVELAGKFEKLSESEGNSTERFGGVISTGFAHDKASLKLEMLRIDDGETAQNAITTQLAITF